MERDGGDEDDETSYEHTEQVYMTKGRNSVEIQQKLKQSRLSLHSLEYEQETPYAIEKSKARHKMKSQ